MNSQEISNVHFDTIDKRPLATIATFRREKAESEVDIY